MSPSATFLYFAYGSNMCEQRLRAADRAPSARALAVARLPRYRLIFNKKSKDRSYKANIVRTGRRSDDVWGVVFEIADSDRAALDRAEGLGQGYEACTVVLQQRNRRRLEARAYLAAPARVAGAPYDWYLRFIIEGAWQQDLPPRYVAIRLLTQAWRRDPGNTRRNANLAVCCSG
jgi:cation transport regulator ChaC